jgi:glucosamine kinase
VIAAAADAIGELIEALIARGAPRIALGGGLAAAIAPHLRPELRARLREPLADALEGALFMAGLPLAP